MLSKLDPGLVKALCVLLSAGLVVLADYYPGAATHLYSLATGLVGSVLVRRPGDIHAAGVHVDDLPDSRS
jgi:hypothetical protein